MPYQKALNKRTDTPNLILSSATEKIEGLPAPGSDSLSAASDALFLDARAPKFQAELCAIHF
jgi:hypothetical protein